VTEKNSRGAYGFEEQRSEEEVSVVLSTDEVVGEVLRAVCAPHDLRGVQFSPQEVQNPR
jgi:hypothetical protein